MRKTAQMARANVHSSVENECKGHIFIYTLVTAQGEWWNAQLKGVITIMRLERNRKYQESHQVLLKNEVERLRGVLFNKGDENIERQIKKRKSFRWTLQPADLEDGKDLASLLFNLERSKFRCIWQRASRRMVLENVVSSKPLTVAARFSSIRNGNEAKAFERRLPETLDEGKSISTEVDFGHRIERGA